MEMENGGLIWGWPINWILGIHKKRKWMELDEKGEMLVECSLWFYSFEGMMVVEMIIELVYWSNEEAQFFLEENYFLLSLEN